MLGIEIVKGSNSKGLEKPPTLLKLETMKETDRLSQIEESKDPEYKRKMTNEEIRSSNLERAELRHQFTSHCGRYKYHIAIIDYLCDYNIEKKLENWFKSKKFTKEKAKLISAVPPEQYEKRFWKFMSREVIINESLQKILNNDTVKLKEFHRMMEAFDDEYHKYYMCEHCGRTYNKKDDRRVTQVS